MRRNVYSTCDSQLPTGKKFVAVNLLTDETLYFVVELKSRVSELFGQICKYLSLCQTELFGLAIRTDSYLFLDTTQKLCKYASKQWKLQNNGVDNTGKPLFSIHMRVQFYVDSYLFISDKVAKLLYYLQLRENVVNYGQALCEERAFMLASYALQADFGNFNPELHVGQYFNPQLYFASWVIEMIGLDYIIEHLPYLHRDHKGIPKFEAQSLYIKEASDANAPHNLHLYRMRNKTTASDVWIGICTTGVEINSEEQRISSIHTNSHSSHTCAKQKTRISYFTWSDIGKLYFDKKKFEIRSIGPSVRKFTYYASSEDAARHLLWLCKVTHQFQLVIQLKMKEIKRRESEMNRKKFRESYIYDQSFDLPLISRIKSGSDYSKSMSSVLDDTSTQRVSVISNASSNTTSGIVSDKVQSIEDSDREDIDIEIMINSAPVVSLESLALSEPIDNSIRRSSTNLEDKQSNSISNITMNCNHNQQNKQKNSDNGVPSSANSIKSTSSEQSNTTIKSIVPLVTTNRQIINIIGNNNNHLYDFCHNESQTSDIIPLKPNTSSTSHELIYSTNIENNTRITQKPDLTVRSVNLSKLTERAESMNHIYENIPYFSQFQNQDIKPKLALRACPSLSSTLTSTTTTPTQRTTTRIGVSSLTRSHVKPTLSVFTPDSHSTPKAQPIAASEPNLHTSPLWTTSPTYLPNRTKLFVNEETNKYQVNPTISSQNNLNKELNINVCNGVNIQLARKLLRDSRAHSDSSAQYTTVPTVNNNQNCFPVTKHLIDCNNELSVQPSFHQSLNNISMTSNHPLRLFASDINVNNNTESKVKSLLIPPPPPQYANSFNEIQYLRSINNNYIDSQFITSQKRNSLITANGRLDSKTYNDEKNGSISDLQQLRQKSRDMNLPLITALFNDRSLMMVPKTVPGSGQRHISTARDIRRYSCSSDISADIPYKHISIMPSRKIESEIHIPKLTINNNRPTSWHIEYPNLQNNYVWEQYHNQQTPGHEFRNKTADFIDRIWAEHQLTT
ncbi:moesin/ezrin/radixin homolog 1-like [Oppia nitens]|uniref:moesin/ezrin/radixin homolog 1-like n=1 Tax=Oppia nitens TaxID=1686743 RepID=UPI0023DB74FC|nr:moesin/ezrin/radixin homolog 1-like [Oppia nitens]